MTTRVLQALRTRVPAEPAEAGEWLIAGLVALGLLLALFI